MKTSARVSTIIIFLFFLFFNGVQVYLVIERISGTKARFINSYSTALLSALAEYNKLKTTDSTKKPDYAFISYSPEKIGINRQDPQNVQLNSSSPIVTDSIEPVFMEMVLNNAAPGTIDLALYDSLFRNVLHARKVHPIYRLDTIALHHKKYDRNLVQKIWSGKREKEFTYSTMPARFAQFSNISVFAQFNPDPVYYRKDLFRPMLGFALLLLIGNAALVFVYKTIRKQKRINEVKTDFINNMTHEMKTPITIASAGLEALEHHVPAGERTGFYLQTSKKQLNLLNNFVERILDAAVQDIPEFQLKKENIALHALFGELLLSHSVLRTKTVNFQLTGEAVIIQGDRLHLETAFHNIIDNAIKYSNGSVDIHIDIVENNRECTIRISDNGMGIPQQYLNNIFEKFFRVPKGDAQSVKGFGLGLYYVHSIIKKHSGSIVVQSKQQSGTEFIITLPKNP